MAVFLDYDGTLTPIVKNPDKANMSEQVRYQQQKASSDLSLEILPHVYQKGICKHSR